MRFFYQIKSKQSNRIKHKSKQCHKAIQQLAFSQLWASKMVVHSKSLVRPACFHFRVEGNLVTDRECLSSNCLNVKIGSSLTKQPRFTKKKKPNLVNQKKFKETFVVLLPRIRYVIYD